jgi:hypothetical protein
MLNRRRPANFKPSTLAHRGPPPPCYVILMAYGVGVCQTRSSSLPISGKEIWMRFVRCGRLGRHVDAVKADSVDVHQCVTSQPSHTMCSSFRRRPRTGAAPTPSTAIFIHMPLSPRVSHSRSSREPSRTMARLPVPLTHRFTAYLLVLLTLHARRWP